MQLGGKASKRKDQLKLEKLRKKVNQEIDGIFKQVKPKAEKEKSAEASPKRAVTEPLKAPKKSRLKNEKTESSWLDAQLGSTKSRGSRESTIVTNSSGHATSTASVVGRTAEGWPIYKEEDFVSTTGGGTSACPFDCDCCY